MDNENKEAVVNKDSKKNKIIMIALIAVSVIAVCVSVVVIILNRPTSALPPDYAPQETEKNMETLAGNPDDTKLPQPEGGGAVGITYSNQVTVNLTEKMASLRFENPQISNQNVLLQIVVQDKVIVQTGIIPPGNKVTKLELENGVEKLLVEGGYEGKIVLHYYQPESGEKTILNTEIPVKITVSK